MNGFDIQIQCEELPGYEEWLEEMRVAEGYYEQEER